MGTHKITNNETGQFLTGVLYSTSGAYFVASIDGTAEETLFEFFNTDWTVEQLPAPLPAEPGLYTVVATNANYHLDDAGNWGQILPEGRYPRTVEYMQSCGELVRLVPATATSSIPVVEQ